jgi:hypothetical protein
MLHSEHVQMGMSVSLAAPTLSKGRMHDAAKSIMSKNSM